MSLKNSKIIQQKNFRPSTTLLENKEPVRLLVIVHQGLVSAVNENLYSNGQHLLYELRENSVIGFASLLSQSPSPLSYVTQTPSLVSAFPVNGNFQNLIMGKLNLGFMAVRSLLHEVHGSYQNFTKLSKLNGLIEKLQDNTALAYSSSLPNLFQNSNPGGDASDPVLQEARRITQNFERNGGQKAHTITREWLQADYSKFLGKSYLKVSNFDSNAFQLYRKILALPMNVQSGIYKADLSILERLAHQLKQMLEQNIKELCALQKSIETGLDNLLGRSEHSYAEKLSLLQKEKNSKMLKVSEKEIDDMLSFFSQACQALLRQYQVLQKVPYKNASQSLSKIEQSQSRTTATKTQQASPAMGRSSAGADGGALRSSLRNSASKIMSLLGTPQDKSKKVLEILKKLKSLSSPLEGSQDARKLRREFTSLYWGIWEKAYHSYRAKGVNSPKEIRMMLDFGFFDEELLDDTHLSFIYAQNSDEGASRYPIVNVREWMEKIYSKKERPSVNELGQSYFEKLKEEHKDENWKRETDVPDTIDTPDKRLSYETQTFLQTNVRLTSGSPASCLPILNRYQMTSPIAKAFVSKKLLEEKIDSIMEIDYSVFHREILVNDEELEIRKEFVQKQIYPYFILIPSTGTKVMMWQEISGRDKSSPGRIILPIFTTEDPRNLLIQALAAFRWELTKTVMGADWNNVGQPSITADYTDYVQFYKKNRELSSEVKEKLSSEFKRFRSDRDRFANDYLSWLQYESQSVMKLNRVARGIFYRHIPFHKKIRDEIREQPAFSEFHNRFRNIRTKKVRELENRYRKFGENIPPILQANINFYKV